MLVDSLPKQVPISEIQEHWRNAVSSQMCAVNSVTSKCVLI
jgi:hypothetical protein